jgi:hypothetical protein
MSQLFNARRFRLLFVKTLLERPVQTFGVAALLLILAFMLYVVAKSLSGFNAAQNLTFIWGLTGGSFFLASFVFGYFNSNAIGSSFLTLPASYFEKWLCGILIAGVLYPVVFLLFYRLIDTGFVAAYHHSLDPASPFYRQQYESVFTFNMNGFLAWKVYPMFFALTGSMFIGALYFNKAALIKTAVAVCVVCLGTVGINWLIADFFFNNVNGLVPFDRIILAVGKEEGTVSLPSGVQSFFFYSICYVLPAILWLLALARLKEKEF